MYFFELPITGLTNDRSTAEGDGAGCQRWGAGQKETPILVVRLTDYIIKLLVAHCRPTGLH